jgi:hypothetical protein
MMPGDDVWKRGDRLHVICSRSEHDRWYATVTAVAPTRLTVIFVDGGPGQFVDRCRASHAPPHRSRHRAAREAAARQTRSDGADAKTQGGEVVMSSRRTRGGGTDATTRGESVAARKSNAPPQGHVRVVVEANMPRQGPIRIMIDNMEWLEEEDGGRAKA